jgi:hypothetical protein
MKTDDEAKVMIVCAICFLCLITILIVGAVITEMNSTKYISITVDGVRIENVSDVVIDGNDVVVKQKDSGLLKVNRQKSSPEKFEK